MRLYFCAYTILEELIRDFCLEYNSISIFFHSLLLKGEIHFLAIRKRSKKGKKV